MKTILMILATCLLAGCVSTGGARDNHEYGRVCGMAMEELGLCSSLPGGRR